MGNGEATNDLANGGRLVRQVEPDPGTDAQSYQYARLCLNCGTARVGDYCHGCGQRGRIHRSLSSVGHDLLHGVFHFEGKIWRTLPMLAWKPGDLTRRYIYGQRASFVSPIALFLFSVFLMFAVLGLTGTLEPAAGDSLRQGIDNSAREQQNLIAGLEKQRAAAQSRGLPTVAIDRKLRGARDDLQVTETLRTRGILTIDTEEERATIAPWLKGPLEKVAKNPDLLFYKLKTNAYKFSWMLIPLSVPFMWLLFPGSGRFHLYDHTVFVTYSLSFMTLLAVLAVLLVKAGLGAVGGLLWLVPPIHMFRQLKGAYELSWHGALWRTIGLLIIAIVASTLFLTIMITLGVLD
jgi:hypothetical protein